jgi:hypothetical protein
MVLITSAKADFIATDLVGGVERVTPHPVPRPAAILKDQGDCNTPGAAVSVPGAPIDSNIQLVLARSAWTAGSFRRVPPLWGSNRPCGWRCAPRRRACRQASTTPTPPSR